MRTKRYFSRSQVDGRYVAKVFMAIHNGRYATFSRETDKETAKWANSSALRGRKYTVTLNGITYRHTDDYCQALREFMRCVQSLKIE